MEVVQYIGGITSVLWGIASVLWEDTFSTVEVVQYSEGIARDSKMQVLVQTTTFRPLLWHANAVDEN